jgi:hypothetical protein
MNIDEIEKFLREARTACGPSPLQDAQVNAVIDLGQSILKRTRPGQSEQHFTHN